MSEPHGGREGLRMHVAVITGAASGIGAAIARRLAADGHPVAILDLNGEAAVKQAALIEEAGGTAIGVPVDVASRPSVDAGVAQVRSWLGRPAILVNNAGVSPAGPFLEISPQTWETTLAVNLTGTFHCCQAVLPDMVEVGWGRIVNISSSSVHGGAARMAAYVASKSGMVGLTKTLALEFSPHGITVNTIPPGFIDTPMMRATAATGFLNVEEQVARTPVRRAGTPQDVAAACAFLVRDEASYITGQVIGVNGGRNT
ncbi:MAG TPA: 3-oxoacyl-ACP reductase FabG [Trebonia sp.]|nr:3-oxoacyl-ACP reductase FabG [Trebonia sp.]